MISGCLKFLPDENFLNFLVCVMFTHVLSISKIMPCQKIEIFKVLNWFGLFCFLFWLLMFLYIVIPTLFDFILCSSIRKISCSSMSSNMSRECSEEIVGVLS